MNLTTQDYIDILLFYKQSIPKTKKKRPSIRKIKKKVHKLLINKLCRCIKSVGGDEKRAIAICNNSIFKQRGYKHYRFTCKKKRSFRPKKSTKHTYLSKTRKKIFY